MEGSGAFELPEDQRSTEMPRTIRELLERTVEWLPDQVALQIKRKDEWVRFSFTEVYDRAKEIALRLQAAGLKKSDRVVLFSENQPEWGIAYLGACFLGLVGGALYVIYLSQTGNVLVRTLWVFPPVLLAGLCGAWFYRYQSQRRKG